MRKHKTRYLWRRRVAALNVLREPDSPLPMCSARRRMWARCRLNDAARQLRQRAPKPMRAELANRLLAVRVANV